MVLDATFLKRWQRELVLKNFENPLFILAWAPEEVIKERLSKREDV
ncbi:AAA family ATPase [Aquifex sp.]